jgi:hypothetical protein
MLVVLFLALAAAGCASIAYDRLRDWDRLNGIRSAIVATVTAMMAFGTGLAAIIRLEGA